MKMGLFCGVARCALVGVVFVLGSCSQANLPGARNVDIPSPVMAAKRQDAVNEAPDSVVYLPLGRDVLVPEAVAGQSLPGDIVGPFELRSETVAGALQLVLSDYEIPLAFETDEGLTRTVTVTSLRGPLDQVVSRICGLADLYCSFESGLLVVKDMQTFMVTVPPIGEDDEVINSLASGIEAITGMTPIVESATRTLIYEATSRTADLAERYFQRVRAGTALIVFEMYIWEVSLESGNSTGIEWEGISDFGKFNSGISISGDVTTESTAVSIGLPTKDSVDLSSGDIVKFLSEYGAVKTISQPQVTVLSGSEAVLRAADTQNYVSSISRSVDNGDSTTSSETASVDTGFTLTVSGDWHAGTIYGNVSIQLQEVLRIDSFSFETTGTSSGSQVQLPQTTEREVETQIRMRPGDSLLIAGLVRENDQFDSSGPGFAEPIIPTSRAATADNRELVFLLKPRVIVYTDENVSAPSSAKNGASRVSLRQPSFGGARGGRAANRGYANAARGGRGSADLPLGTIPLNLLDPSTF